MNLPTELFNHVFTFLSIENWYRLKRVSHEFSKIKIKPLLNQSVTIRRHESPFATVNDSFFYHWNSASSVVEKWQYKDDRYVLVSCAQLETNLNLFSNSLTLRVTNELIAVLIENYDEEMYELIIWRNLLSVTKIAHHRFPIDYNNITETEIDFDLTDTFFVLYHPKLFHKLSFYTLFEAKLFQILQIPKNFKVLHDEFKCCNFYTFLNTL